MPALITCRAQNEKNNDATNMDYQSLFILILVIAVVIWAFNRSGFKVNSKRRSGDSKNDDVLSDTLMRAFKSRRGYYRDVYLKSDAWKRKRYVVLKRDNWRCVHCGARATQVHHKRYAPKNIGKEPIEWLESVCNSCHDFLHL